MRNFNKPGSSPEGARDQAYSLLLWVTSAPLQSPSKDGHVAERSTLSRDFVIKYFQGLELSDREIHLKLRELFPENILGNDPNLPPD